MRTHHGNLGAVVADIGIITFAQLSKYNIPFHDIHFGKPWADVYIDDLAVNANLDTMQEVGWLLDEPSAAAARSEDTKKAGIVAARDFNTIQIINDKVIKSSKSDNILGEVFFYSHMPQGISHIFPSIYSVDFIEETSTYTIGMENRRGLTYSHLLAGRSLTKGRLYQFLRTLHQVHSVETVKGEATLPIPPALANKFPNHSVGKWPQGANIYDNYGTKLRRRYGDHRKQYDALGPMAASLFSRLDEFLDTYEAEKRAVEASVIHGDPVFSNAILSPDGKAVSFIDVRCQLGQILTSAGDINCRYSPSPTRMKRLTMYLDDLAKVLQSLCGYDHVLFLSTQPNANLADIGDSKAPVLEQADSEMLEGLREDFFTFIQETYPVRLHRKTLFRITASLFFSLIPLHRPEMGKVFLRLCQETLDKASGMQEGMTY